MAWEWLALFAVVWGGSLAFMYHTNGVLISGFVIFRFRRWLRKLCDYCIGTSLHRKRSNRPRQRYSITLGSYVSIQVGIESCYRLLHIEASQLKI